MYNLFYSLISFVIAIFFVLIGIVSTLIPWSENVRNFLVNLILHDSLAISLFGFAFIIIGLAIIIDILLNTRRSYYRVKSDDSSILVDENVIQQSLSIYWKELFPDQDIPNRMVLKNNRIHITVDLPYQPPAAQRSLVDRIKNDLKRQFAEQLGYHEEFVLSASFQAPPKQKKNN